MIFKHKTKLIAATVLLIFELVLMASCSNNPDSQQTEPEYVQEQIKTETVAAATPEPAAEKSIEEMLSGKNISILGDSISTFCLGDEKYSNNGKYNSTIVSNDVWYNSDTKLDSADETYWKIIIDKYNMNLVVNNSYSGGFMSNSDWGNAGFIRCENLHADVDGMNAEGTVPDIVVIYLGTNDMNYNLHVGSVDDVNPEDYGKNILGLYPHDHGVKSFTDAYAFTISKINELYDTPDIFVLTLLPNGLMPDSMYPQVRKGFNAAIESMAELYDNVTVVNLNETPIKEGNFSEYYADACLHPNREGMECIAEVLDKAIISKYSREII